MARGGTKTAEQMAQGDYGAAQTAGSTAAGEQSASYGALMPQIMQMLQPGGNPAVTAATMGSLGSSYGSADAGAKDTAARTNNAAATNATEDQLARSKGATFAQQAADNVMNQQSNADKLLAGIFGQSSTNRNSALNSQVGSTNAYSGAVKTGGGVLGPILQMIGNSAKGAAGASQAGGAAAA